MTPAERRAAHVWAVLSAAWVEGGDVDSHAELEAPSTALMYRSERIVLRVGPSNGRYNKAFLGWSRVYSIARIASSPPG